VIAAAQTGRKIDQLLPSGCVRSVVCSTRQTDGVFTLMKLEERQSEEVIRRHRAIESAVRECPPPQLPPCREKYILLL